VGKGGGDEKEVPWTFLNSSIKILILRTKIFFRRGQCKPSNIIISS
jgi:hypothetical protein